MVNKKLTKWSTNEHRTMVLKMFLTELAAKARITQFYIKQGL